jgi:hypothetical protein
VLTFSSQPDERSHKAQETQVTPGELVEPGKDTSIMLDFVDKAFDQVPLSIEVWVVIAALGPVFPWWNDRNGTQRLDAGDEIIGVIALVGDDKAAWVVGEQSGRLRDIVCLAPGELEVQRVAQGIDTEMNLGAEPTTTAP